MSNVTGQAFFSVDSYDYDGTDFMRVNLGIEIETLLDIGELEVGRYHRWENGDACLECDGTEPGLERHAADLMLENFSLGHIDKDTGEIDPFYLNEPFLEFALDDQGTPIGVRLGFANAKGWLSGNIQSLTGNIDIAIQDTAYGLSQMAPDCSAGAYECFLGLLLSILGPPILQGSPLEAEANLISPEGELDPVRANMVGLENGKEFRADGTGEINFFERGLLDLMIALTPSRYNARREGDVVIFEAANCDILSVPVCFDFRKA
ncbi:hypothetical protein [Oleiphilus messinensis]|nr:hypothetical protein [Oleiphilus messinensis]